MKSNGTFELAIMTLVWHLHRFVEDRKARRLQSCDQTSLIRERIGKIELMPVPTSPPDEVTQLLLDWNAGDHDALEKLMPLVYKELRRLAHNYLGKEAAGHTMLTTDLVHEAYLKLVDQHRVRWQNRAHFFGIAATLMRRILVDHARGRKRIKRGAGAQQVSFEETAIVTRESTVDIIALDEALKRLAGLDERKAKVVELRFFGGLEVEEVAEFLKLSSTTVLREWKMAKAWLHRALSDET
jgi:RNA polymerase sigma-70 factor, ECF subfamily